MFGPIRGFSFQNGNPRQMVGDPYGFNEYLMNVVNLV